MDRPTGPHCPSGLRQPSYAFLPPGLGVAPGHYRRQPSAQFGRCRSNRRFRARYGTAQRPSADGELPPFFRDLPADEPSSVLRAKLRCARPRALLPENGRGAGSAARRSHKRARRPAGPRPRRLPSPHTHTHTPTHPPTHRPPVPGAAATDPVRVAPTAIRVGHSRAAAGPPLFRPAGPRQATGRVPQPLGSGGSQRPRARTGRGQSPSRAFPAR